MFTDVSDETILNLLHTHGVPSQVQLGLRRQVPEKGTVFLNLEGRTDLTFKWFSPSYPHSDLMKAADIISQASENGDRGNVIIYDPTLQKDSKIVFAISHYIHGPTVHQFLMQRHKLSKKYDALYAAGYTIGKLHSVKSNLFGNLFSPDVSFYGSLTSPVYDQYYFGRVNFYLEMLDNNELWKKEGLSDQVREYVAFRLKYMPELKPSLIQGDCSLEHFIYDPKQGKVIGVIDVEKTRYDHPSLDLLRATETEDHMNDWKDIIDMNEFWKGYQQGGGIDKQEIKTWSWLPPLDDLLNFGYHLVLRGHIGGHEPMPTIIEATKRELKEYAS